MEQPATTTSHEPPQDAPLEFAARLDPIGLEELNVVAALQIRVDRKYVVPLPVAMRVLSGLESSARVLHMDGLRRFGYNSVYFDTPEALRPPPPLQDSHPQLPRHRNHLPRGQDRGSQRSHGERAHRI